MLISDKYIFITYTFEQDYIAQAIHVTRHNKGCNALHVSTAGVVVNFKYNTFITCT